MLSDQKICEDFTLVKHARDAIVHTVNIARNADGLASIARMYVGPAIQAALREAVQAAPRVGQASS